MLKGQKRPRKKYAGSKPRALTFFLVRGPFVKGQTDNILAEADNEEEARNVAALIRPGQGGDWYAITVQGDVRRAPVPRPDIPGRHPSDRE